jgi:hypothetical protein
MSFRGGVDVGLRVVRYNVKDRRMPADIRFVSIFFAGCRLATRFSELLGRTRLADRCINLTLHYCVVFVYASLSVAIAGVRVTQSPEQSL